MNENFINEHQRIKSFNEDLHAVCKKHAIEVKWYEFRIHEKLPRGFFQLTVGDMRINTVIWNDTFGINKVNGGKRQ